MHNTTSHVQSERPRCPQKGLYEICRSANDDISKHHYVRQTLSHIPPYLVKSYRYWLPYLLFLGYYCMEQILVVTNLKGTCTYMKPPRISPYPRNKSGRLLL
jgi:hypothetical protein